MPAILKRLTRQLRSKGVQNSRAVAISQLQKHGILKEGSSEELTSHGKTRNAMSAGERAKDRAAKYSKGKHSADDYNYNPKTNRARLKKSK